MLKFNLTILTLALLLTTSAQASKQETELGAYLKRNDVQSFIQTISKQHDFDPEQLKQWFSAIRPRPDIIEAISSPAEGKAWHQYRKIFIKEKRIAGGVTFWTENRELLERAEKETGVPARIIVAILGVETLYNTYKGRYKVLESLATLAFDYPKRAKFFRSELEQFLLLAREERVDPLMLKGSYAGAMGGPQFISSSFRHYAVDFDNDNKRDIWSNPADMIGSVANYFKVHGWQKGQSVTHKARVSGSHTDKIVEKGIKPAYSISELKDKGVSTSDKVALDRKAALIKLEQENGVDYWLGMKNFYVITRYNHSPLYAMAVYQLSEKIAERMNAR